MSNRHLRGGYTAAARECASVFKHAQRFIPICRLLLAYTNEEGYSLPASFVDVTTRMQPIGVIIRRIGRLLEDVRWLSHTIMRDSASVAVPSTSLEIDFDALQTPHTQFLHAYMKRIPLHRYPAVCIALYILYTAVHVCIHNPTDTELASACTTWMHAWGDRIRNLIPSADYIRFPTRENVDWTPPRSTPVDWHAFDPALGSIVEMAHLMPHTTHKVSIPPILTAIFQAVANRSGASLVSLIKEDETQRASFRRGDIPVCLEMVAPTRMISPRLALVIVMAFTYTQDIKVNWKDSDLVTSAISFAENEPRVVVRALEQLYLFFRANNVSLAHTCTHLRVNPFSDLARISMFWKTVARIQPKYVFDRDERRLIRPLIDTTRIPDSDRTVVPAVVPESSRVSYMSLVRIVNAVYARHGFTDIAPMNGVLPHVFQRHGCSRNMIVSMFLAHPDLLPIALSIADAYIAWESSFSITLPTTWKCAQSRALASRYSEYIPYADTVRVCTHCHLFLHASIPMPPPFHTFKIARKTGKSALLDYQINDSLKTEGCVERTYTYAGFDVRMRENGPTMMCGGCERVLTPFVGTGRFVFTNGRIHTVCSMMGCGVVCEYAPQRSVVGPDGVVCHACMAKPFIPMTRAS